MQYPIRNKASAPRLVAAAAMLLLLGGFARAQVAGTITTTDRRTVQGQIRWLSAARKYVIMTARPDGAQFEVELQPGQVASIAVPQPPALAAAIKEARGGNLRQAIPALEKIIRDYAMLQWDEPAARALAEAQMANNDPAAAAKACEVVTAMKPEAAYSGDLAVIYWQALLKSNRSAKLSDLLVEAIAKGGQTASARALIMRGDLLMDKKQPRDALVDGYLRVVVLYENVREAQPEALYKAGKAFDALNQNPNAEKMRSKLRAQYPGSKYATML